MTSPTRLNDKIPTSSRDLSLLGGGTRETWDQGRGSQRKLLSSQSQVNGSIRGMSCDSLSCTQKNDQPRSITNLLIRQII